MQQFLEERTKELLKELEESQNKLRNLNEHIEVAKSNFNKVLGQFNEIKNICELFYKNNLTNHEDNKE
jgi:hypothetical protein